MSDLTLWEKLCDLFFPIKRYFYNKKYKKENKQFKKFDNFVLRELEIQLHDLLSCELSDYYYKVYGDKYGDRFGYADDMLVREFNSDPLKVDIASSTSYYLNDSENKEALENCDGSLEVLHLHSNEYLWALLNYKQLADELKTCLDNYILTGSTHK